MKVYAVRFKAHAKDFGTYLHSRNRTAGPSLYFRKGDAKAQCTWYNTNECGGRYAEVVCFELVEVKE